MFYHEYDDVEHPAPLPRFRIIDQDSTSSDDSEVDVISLFDPDMFIPLTMTQMKREKKKKRTIESLTKICVETDPDLIPTLLRAVQEYDLSFVRSDLNLIQI